MSAPDAAWAARFGADLAATGGQAAEGVVALAVSGGADSMAMLALAQAARPGRVIAATVDHRLRAANRDEAAMVAAHSMALGVPHATLTVCEDLAGADLQARARAARYDLLARWALEHGAACLLTAHHADDQAETFLMRAVRGAGPAGLAGIRARRVLTVCDAVPVPAAGGVVAAVDERRLVLLRPLLGWRRATLRAIATATATPFVDDPSNADERFERARVRQLLAAQPWLDPAGLARAAAHAGEAQAAIEATVDWLWQARRVVPAGVAHPECQTWLDMADLPRELRRRLAREAIRGVKRINGILPDFDMAANIEPLLDALAAGRAATQAGVLVTPRGSVWRFAEAPPRRSG